MKPAAIWTTMTLFLACSIALLMKTEVTAVSMILTMIALWPLLVSLLMLIFCREKQPTNILLASVILYVLWFAFIYGQIFFWNVDPQGSIALLFLGIYSLPFTLALWITALVKEAKQRQRAASARGV